MPGFLFSFLFSAVELIEQKSIIEADSNTKLTNILELIRLIHHND